MNVEVAIGRLELEVAGVERRAAEAFVRSILEAVETALDVSLPELDEVIEIPRIDLSIRAEGAKAIGEAIASRVVEACALSRVSEPVRRPAALRAEPARVRAERYRSAAEAVRLGLGHRLSFEGVSGAGAEEKQARPIEVLNLIGRALARHGRRRAAALVSGWLDEATCRGVLAAVDRQLASIAGVAGSVRPELLSVFARSDHVWPNVSVAARRVWAIAELVRRSPHVVRDDPALAAEVRAVIAQLEVSTGHALELSDDRLEPGARHPNVRENDVAEAASGPSRAPAAQISSKPTGDSRAALSANVRAEETEPHRAAAGLDGQAPLDALAALASAELEYTSRIATEVAGLAFFASTYEAETPTDVLAINRRIIERELGPKFADDPAIWALAGFNDPPSDPRSDPSSDPSSDPPPAETFDDLDHEMIDRRAAASIEAVAARLRATERADLPEIRALLASPGTIALHPDRIEVTLPYPRAYLALLCAGLLADLHRVPWLDDRPLRLIFADEPRGEKPWTR